MVAAAALTAVKEKEIRFGDVGCTIITGLLTTTADWYDTKFDTVYSVICTPADAEAVGVTLSTTTGVTGVRVVFEKTTSAVLNVKIWGI